MTVSPDVRTARHPLTADGSVELAVLDRNGFDESRHIGAGVVVASDGTVLDAVGDVGASIYPRSTMKPFQALAVRRAGARFSDEELVLTTASHAGTAAHQALALHMLESFDHVEADLGCPPDMPFDRATGRTRDGPRRLAMNCSGKHAGMLAACRVNGWDEDTYLDMAHPMQQLVEDTVEEFTHETVDLVGTDGCGAPVFPLTLTGLARVSPAWRHAPTRTPPHSSTPCSTTPGPSTASAAPTPSPSSDSAYSRSSVPRASWSWGCRTAPRWR